MFRKLGMIIRSQKGFTLIEILVAIPIIGIIGVAVGMAISQVFIVDEMSVNRETVVKQVENAVEYISRDAQQAQVTGANGSNINFQWTDWTNNNSLAVSYTLNNDSLQRIEAINNGQPLTTIIAKYITGFNCTTSSGVLNITITATVDGFKSASETRTFQVKPRPGQ
jgi:prepilin-type N-terminal cleavage/methylation domain-containing protein